MPITQDRMISLIKAARDYQAQFRELKDFITESVRAVQAGEDSPTDAIHLIEHQASILRPSEESAATILIEERHFKKHFKHNQYERLRQAVRRGNQQEPIRPAPSTAPRQSTKPLAPAPTHLSDSTVSLGEHRIELDPQSANRPPAATEDLFAQAPSTSHKIYPPKPDWAGSQSEWEEYCDSSGVHHQISRPHH